MYSAVRWANLLTPNFRRFLLIVGHRRLSLFEFVVPPPKVKLPLRYGRLLHIDRRMARCFDRFFRKVIAQRRCNSVMVRDQEHAAPAKLLRVAALVIRAEGMNLLRRFS